MRVTQWLLPTLAFVFMIFGFQNCIPTGGFSAIEGGDMATLSSTSESMKACNATKLAPGESCVIPIQFTPKDKGNRTGTVDISIDGKEHAQIQLNGQGI